VLPAEHGVEIESRQEETDTGSGKEQSNKATNENEQETSGPLGVLVSAYVILPECITI